MLLDLVILRVNGLEDLRWIKAERPEIKVIIVTVYTKDAYHQAAEASGTDVFLLKKVLAPSCCRQSSACSALWHRRRCHKKRSGKSVLVPSTV
jgi:DNA-binding NarL/FixJ family response regulator